jgi:hypothetical protein
MEARNLIIQFLFACFGHPLPSKLALNLLSFECEFVTVARDSPTVPLAISCSVLANDGYTGSLETDPPPESPEA